MRLSSKQIRQHLLQRQTKHIGVTSSETKYQEPFPVMMDSNIIYALEQDITEQNKSKHAL